MCTFKTERTVLVCDVAINQVRERLKAAFDAEVRYTVVDGEGTLVEAAPGSDAERFTETARAAIAAVANLDPGEVGGSPDQA